MLCPVRHVFVAALIGAAFAAQTTYAAQLVHHIQIDGIIDGGLAAFVERTIDEADELGVDAIILELDTFGGRVDAADVIRQALLDAPMTTIAWINKNAASAGALISIACDTVAKAPGSAIGAATPVNQEGVKASEKMVSYFRKIMGVTADAKNRPKEVAEAMVDEDIAIDSLIAEGKLLTLGPDEAIKWGIANQLADNFDEVLEKNGLDGASVVGQRINWAEEIVRWLTHPVVSSLLMTVGFGGLLFEIRTPGFGVGGIIGLVCLVLFFGSAYVTHLAGAEEIILFFVGVALVVVELFVPGFGVFGLLGAVAITASLFLSMVGRWPTTTPQELLQAATYLGLSVIATFGLLAVTWGILPRVGAFRRLILPEVQLADRGYRGTDASRFEGMVGRQGFAASQLRPTGLGSFDDERIDVVSDSEFIEEGTAIVIAKIEGAKVVVRPV